MKGDISPFGKAALRIFSPGSRPSYRIFMCIYKIKGDEHHEMNNYKAHPLLGRGVEERPETSESRRNEARSFYQKLGG